jgi:hypothetical protein
MAITTQDQLVASYPGQTEPYQKSALGGTFAVGNYVSLWTAGGSPGAGAAQGTAAGAVPTSATAGACVFTNPTSGNSYIAKGFFASGVVGALILYDRLAHGSALSGTVTTAQTIGSPALTRPDANGTATEMFIEWYTATGATPTTATVSYTNQSGTAGQTSGTSTVPANAPAALMSPIPLAAGDTGVRAIASLTLLASTGTAGNFGYTIIRKLAIIPCTIAQVAQAMDVFMLGMPQVFNSACISAMFLVGSGTAAPAINGLFSLVQG